MDEVDYKRVREIMWTDKRYRLRELPDFYGFPLIIKVIKGTTDVEEKESISKGEVLRIHDDQSQRRVIATDGKGRHWSFPVHIGAKFDVPGKKDRRKSLYMSEMVEADKLPKKFTFARKDDMQINITGEDPATAGPLIKGEFKTKEVTKVRVFKANRITDDEIDPTVVFLPAYMDLEVTIATKIACEPDAFWEDYMDAISSDISKKVNLNMYRGKSDIQIYEFQDKGKKSKRSSTCLYEEHAPVKIVTIGSIIKKRTPSTRSDSEGKRLSRTPSESSTNSNSKLKSFAPLEPEEPPRDVKDILNDLQDKDESEMTDEEIRMAKHRKRMLAFLAREEEEMLTQGKPEGDAGEDEADKTKDRGEGDGDDVDETCGSPGESASSVTAVGSPSSSILDDVAKRPRSPGDGSPIAKSEADSESMFVKDLPDPERRLPPRIPTRRTPGRSYSGAPQIPNDSHPETHAAPNPNETPPVVSPKSDSKPVIPVKPTRDHRPPVVPRAGTQIKTAKIVTSSNLSRYSCIQDYPPELQGMSIDDMCQALLLLRLDKYEERIREHSIDGEMAKELTENMIKSDLGMSGLEAKKLYKFIHHNWRPI